MHRVIAKNTAARRHMKTTWDYAVEVPSCFPTVRPDAFMHFALGLYDEKEFKYVVQVAERASLQYNDESPDRLPEWDGFRTEGNLEKMKTLLASCYHILARNTSTDLMQEANLLNPDSTTRIWREDEYQNMRDPVGLYQRLMCYMSEIEAATWRLKNDLTRRDF
ncbi:hypothetical protein N7491_004654 [Penicillium cf. griseofulvum]|uniref:Uncharacterized protein n=1 Tax=Penicillium cf. griseofulvum TaxID=2972120 RepID=A0A9W9J0V6_9EURO|nr:hypothetical protein N7472_007344 [Penicillium cf. griseofulvum]KAJ5434059.1 hypothetical protein N7491_004654 [Penicillium cf. griseofulvum]